MDLGLSEEQELLKNAARDFLEKECPETLVREMEEDEKGYSPDLWKKMAEQGWQGLLIPEAHGGADFGYLDLIVLIEEFGRALVPGPFISTQVGGVLPLLEGGTRPAEELRAAEDRQRQRDLDARLHRAVRALRHRGRRARGEGRRQRRRAERHEAVRPRRERRRLLHRRRPQARHEGR